MESKKLALFNKISFFSLIGTFFLSIFFFIPYSNLSLSIHKGFLISLGVTISIFFWLMARLSDGKFVIPRDRIIFFGLLIPIVFFLSSFFSISPYLSFFGSGFEVGTFGSMLIFFLVLFLSSIYFQTEKGVGYFLKSILLGTFILGFIELLFVFTKLDSSLVNFFRGLSFGNLFGTWYEYALLFGSTIILSVLALEFKPLRIAQKVFLYFMVGSGLFFLILANSTFVWSIVGVFTLFIFVYSISSYRTLVEKNSKEGIPVKEKSFPMTAFIVVLFCLLFIVGKTSIGNIAPNYFNISTAEVSPSVKSTMHIAGKALSKNFLFGTGPNTFAVDWSQWKPQDVVNTQFWSVDFVSGFGMIPTFIVTSGLLGILAWFLFVGVFLLRGFQAMRFMLRNVSAHYYMMSSLFLAIYFWISLFRSNPNSTIVMLAFASTGVFLGMLASKRALPVLDNSFFSNAKISFVSILGLVVLMIASLATTYVYIEKFSALSAYSKSTLNTQDPTIEELTKREEKLVRATLFDKNDIYYRELSNIHIAKINSIASNSNISPDTVKSVLQTLVSSAESAANSAVSQNPRYYKNWVNLGDVYAYILSIGVTSNAYTNAMNAYDKALEYSPNTPSILLAKSRLEIVNKDNAKAREFANQALAVKLNYIDAIFTLAQIDTNEGNLTEAINQAVRASEIAPTDPSVFFRLGVLRYNASDYTKAINAFETAVRLNTNYLNARYFLGLSYQKAGRIEDAKKQFTILQQILPQSIEVENALENLSTNEVISEDEKSLEKLPLPEDKE